MCSCNSLSVSLRAADDLHRALAATGVGDDSPVMLVGVEYSCMVARFYAQAYEQ